MLVNLHPSAHSKLVSELHICEARFMFPAPIDLHESVRTFIRLHLPFTDIRWLSYAICARLFVMSGLTLKLWHTTCEMKEPMHTTVKIDNCKKFTVVWSGAFENNRAVKRGITKKITKQINIKVVCIALAYCHLAK